MAENKRILVVYYSLTGTTSKVAKDLAARLDADLESISDTRHGAGWFKYLQASINAWRRSTTNIGTLQHNPADYKLTIVGTPTWSWQMTPAVRTYLQQVGGKIRRAAFFITSGDTDVARIAPSMEALANRKAVAALGFNARELNDSGTYEKKLVSFMQSIKDALAENDHDMK